MYKFLLFFSIILYFLNRYIKHIKKLLYYTSFFGLNILNFVVIFNILSYVIVVSINLKSKLFFLNNKIFINIYINFLSVFLIFLNKRSL
jgi:hypothetical protein